MGEPYDLLQNQYVDTYGLTCKSGLRNLYGNRYLGPTRKVQKDTFWLQSPEMPMICMLLYIIRKNSIFQTKSNHQITCSANSVSGSECPSKICAQWVIPYDLLQNRHVDTYGPRCKSGRRNPCVNRYLGLPRGPRMAQKDTIWL